MRLNLSPTAPRSHITVSENNKKMGVSILSFSTPAVKSCPRGLPCYMACYAKAYEDKRDSVHKSYINNMEMLKKYPDEVENKLVGVINLIGCKYFRFSVSGDVAIDPERPYLYVNLIINVAKRCKNTYFLAFSKSDLWNDMKIPKNLNIVYSSWLDWHVFNPTDRKGRNKFPTTNVISKKDVRDGMNICPNCLNKNILCENCHHCWHMKPADEPILFIAHGIHRNKIK